MHCSQKKKKDSSDMKSAITKITERERWYDEEIAKINKKELKL